jgi:thymidylate kinase
LSHYFKDAVENLDKNIRPALADGKIVICDDKLSRHTQDEAFLSRTRFGYSQIAKEFPDKTIVVNGNQPV